jgi:hypothetical protein
MLVSEERALFDRAEGFGPHKRTGTPVRILACHNGYSRENQSFYPDLLICEGLRTLLRVLTKMHVSRCQKFASSHNAFLRTAVNNIFE